MTITITFDREDLQNPLKHFGLAVNSIGGITPPGNYFSDHLQSLTDTFIEFLLSESETPEPTESEPKDTLLGYSVYHLGNENLPYAGIKETSAEVEKTLTTYSNPDLYRIIEIHKTEGF